MFDAAKEALAGTAREASENYRYSRLEERYGKRGAEAIIKPELEKRGVSLKEFRTYRKVKKVVQQQGLDVAKAQKDADQEAKAAIDEVFITA